MLGYETAGCGPTTVFMLHDWLGDHTTYDPCRPYLDQSRFTWVFPDLRGYGLSRHLDGFGLDHAVADLIELADHLGIARFAVAGHSMTGMVALRLALDHPDRVSGIVLAAAVTAEGLALDDAGKAFFEAVAADQSACRDVVAAVTGARYDPIWLDYKARRSREVSTLEARQGYLRNMLLGGRFTGDFAAMTMPVLVLTGAFDTDGFRDADLRGRLDGVVPNCRFETIHEAGHYPMQETPVRYASLVQAFLS